MQFKLATSKDGRFARIALETGEESVAQLSAQDVEQLISILSNARGKMVPRVSQSKSPLLSPGPGIDALSPMLDVGRMDSGHLILSLAYTGLGWRSAQLDPDEARALARRLLDAAGPP